MSIRPKKRNLFAFFKSDDFNEARMKMCATYILLSYVNELHEDVDRLLHGYEGLFIGSLKKASKDASKALEDYDKAYRAHILDDGTYKLGDTTIEVTAALDETIAENAEHLSKGYSEVVRRLDSLIEEKVRDEEELNRNIADDFEIIGRKELAETIEYVVNQVRRHPEYDKGYDAKSFEEGVRKGFATAVGWVNNLYLNAK